MASDEQRAYREKLRTLQFSGRVPKPMPVVDKAAGTKTTTVMDEERGGGRVAGYQTEHKDGHVDATITPPVVRKTYKGKVAE